MPPETDEDTDQNRCMQLAAETALNLPAYAWGIYTARQSPGGAFHVGAERNVATTTYCINGTYGLAGAVSGRADRPGLIGVPNVIWIDPGSKQNEAEWKIVNQLFAAFQEATHPSIDYLYSQFAICPDCRNAINEYITKSGVPVVAWDSGFTPPVFRRRFEDLR